MIDVSNLPYVFKLVQTCMWIFAFVIALVMLGQPQWKNSRWTLRLSVSVWTAATAAMSIYTLSATIETLFPQGFRWWHGLTPLLVSVAPTILLWHCHSVMNELSKNNNRRHSKLLASRSYYRPDNLGKEIDVPPILR